MFYLTLIAFVAGFLTVLSPCILPILPILLSTGVAGGALRPYGIIAGLVTSFSFFTLFLAALVSATGISPNYLRLGAIMLVIIFGLIMIFPKLNEYFTKLTSYLSNVGAPLQQESEKISAGFWSGFLLGCALGLIWTPCAGPVLATIITLIAVNGITLSSIVGVIGYALGAAIPMLAIILAGNKLFSSISFLSAHAERIRQVFGVLILASALALLFHADIFIQQYIARFIPTISLEQSKPFTSVLERIEPSLKNSATDMKQAPELVGITDWINTSPLTLAQLKGRVVLIDFWTYSCINCVRTLPYLKEWYSKYKDKGLVIIGVHTPEFEFEKSLSNVKDAVKRLEITYPVALDSNYGTWRNYHNKFWPAHYLINQEGTLVDTHFGEGAYQETENKIRGLLGMASAEQKDEAPKQSRMPLTPETYLGYARADHYQLEQPISKDSFAIYDFKEPLKQDFVGLKGSWEIRSEYIESDSTAQLALKFIANRVYVVLEPDGKNKIVSILLDGKPLPRAYQTKDTDAQGRIKVDQARMYDVADLKGAYGSHILTLQVPPGVHVHVFTFGTDTN